MHDGPNIGHGYEWSSNHSIIPSPFLGAVIEPLLHHPDITELLLAAHPDLTRDDVQAFLAYVQAMVIGEDVFPQLPKGAHTMPKELKNKREEKKKSTMTPKEKQAAKRAKKASRVVTSA
jgi:hypothetical protein